MIVPLTPITPQADRKARVAELSDLWYKSGFSLTVMTLLVDERRKEIINSEKEIFE
jgi:hypothetical protein